MLYTIIGSILGLLLLIVLYIEVKSRKTLNKIALVEIQEGVKKPKHIPYADPVYSLVKGFIDFFRGRALRGESIDLACRRLMTEDIHGSRDLKWLQNYFVGIHFVNTWSADAAREILFTKDDFVGKQDFGQELNKKFISESILNVEGEEWKHQKKLLSPAFSYDHLRVVAPDIVNVSEELVNHLAEFAGKPLKIHPIMQKATLEVIGRTGFGISFRALSDNKTEELVNYEKLMEEFQNPIHFFTKLDAILGSKARLYKRLDDFEKFMLSIVDKKRQLIQEKGVEYAPTDILDMLVSGHDSEEGILGDRQLIHNLNTFFIAGHETTAGAVASAIHLLSEYPDVQDRLYNEISRVCGTHPPTYDNLKELEFLHLCLKETLRLFPPAPLMVRKVKKELTIDGYRFPPDTTFGIFTYTIHRDPQYWENPDTFDPDRFSDANKHKRHRYAWIPFSLGPRQCIGNNLALMEMKIMLIRIIQKYRVIPDPKSEKPLMPYMALVVQPHPKASIILEPR